MSDNKLSLHIGTKNPNSLYSGFKDVQAAQPLSLNRQTIVGFDGPVGIEHAGSIANPCTWGKRCPKPPPAETGDPNSSIVHNTVPILCESCTC